MQMRQRLIVIAPARMNRSYQFVRRIDLPFRSSFGAQSEALSGIVQGLVVFPEFKACFRTPEQRICCASWIRITPAGCRRLPARPADDKAWGVSNSRHGASSGWRSCAAPRSAH